MADHVRRRDVYPHLANWTAFTDKVVIDVCGTKRKKPIKRIVGRRNLPIGGPHSFYARCDRGRSAVSGNTLQVRYGVMRPYKNLSPFKVTVWAGKRPVMCADVLIVLDGLMRQGYRTRVSAAELTFDLEGFPLSQLTEELCTRARIYEKKGKHGWTLYVGSVNSPWQAKIYERTPSVVRVEFTFRSVFLRRHAVFKAQDLYLLRKARLWDLISFREVDQTHGDALPPRIKIPWTQLGHGLPPDMPASIVLKALREAHVDPSLWVVRSPREVVLRRMQRNLIW